MILQVRIPKGLQTHFSYVHTLKERAVSRSRQVIADSQPRVPLEGDPDPPRDRTLRIGTFLRSATDFRGSSVLRGAGQRRQGKRQGNCFVLPCSFVFRSGRLYIGGGEVCRCCET